MQRFAAVLAFVSFAAAQQQPETLIRINTRLVEVNVVAHDKFGAVADLTKDDFILTDHGKPIPISFFSIETNKRPATAVARLPQNVFSNSPAARSSTQQSVTVVLLDGLNTKIEDQAYARQQVLKFLKQLNPDERVALYTLGSSLKILNDFTDDPEQLRRTLAKYLGTMTSDATLAEPLPSDSGDSDMDAFLDAANQKFADAANANKAVNTLAALEAIASHIGGLPGRKNLVWVSGSFPLMIGFDDSSAWGDPSREMRTFNDEITRATRALNNSNIAVYPVDARGLVGLPASLSAANKGKITNTPVSLHPKNLDTLDEIASATGGRAFYNTNDLAGAVRKAIEDSEVSYTIGFYPEPEKLDGKFHELKLQVKRKGVNVRYRKGYIAFKDEPLTPARIDNEIRTAVWSPIESSAINLTGRVDRVDKPQPNLLRVMLSTDIRKFHLEARDDRMVGKVEVLFLQQDKAGKTLDSRRQTVDLKLQKATYEAYLKSGLTMAQYIEPKKDLAVLRVVIVDQPSGLLGSLIVPLMKVK